MIVNHEFDFCADSNIRHYMVLTAYKLANSDSNFLASAGGLIENVVSKVDKDASKVIDYDFSSIIKDVTQMVKDKTLTENISKFVKGYTDIAESGGKINIQNPEFVFRLPIPQNLDSQLSHKYDSDRQALDTLFSKDKKDGLQNKLNTEVGNVFDKLKPEGKGKWSKFGQAGVELVQRGFMGVPSVAAQMMQRQQNITIDPHLITTYDETDLRVFRYSTPIIPYSKDHSKIISTGIAKLKELSAGSEMDGDVGLFIHQPYVWTISFGSRDAGSGDDAYGDKLNKELSQILRISNFTQFNITAININYSKGNMLLMEDGLPKLFEITISLQERMPYRRGFFQNKE